MSNKYMFQAMLELADQDCSTLIKAEDNNANTLYLKALALIIVSRLRPFLRELSELEVYKLTKEIKALNKVKATDRHTISSYIKQFI